MSDKIRPEYRDLTKQELDAVINGKVQDDAPPAKKIKIIYEHSETKLKNSQETIDLTMTDGDESDSSVFESDSDPETTPLPAENKCVLLQKFYRNKK